MNRILVIIILALIIVGLAFLNFARAYDQMKPDVDPVIDFDSNFTYIRVKVIGTATGMYYNDGWKTRETTYSQQGSGFVVKEGFIMTAAHVIIPDMVHTQIGTSSVQATKPLNILTRIILIYDYKDTPLIAKLHYIDQELDIAILKYNPTGILKPANYEIHYAQEMLKQGDVVFSYLHKRDEDGNATSDLEIVYGTVLSNLPTTPKMGSDVAFLSPYDITLQMEIQGGDSGSPLFALDDGVPIYIGILRAMYYDEIMELTYAVSLPNIRRYLVIEEKKKIILMLPNMEEK